MNKKLNIIELNDFYNNEKINYVIKGIVRDAVQSFINTNDTPVNIPGFNFDVSKPLVYNEVYMTILEDLGLIEDIKTY
jgi:hypothetical protein